MTHPPPRNRRLADHEPVTAGEVARWVERHERDSEKAHRDIMRAIARGDERQERSDDRIDKLATRVSIIFAVVGVLWAVFLVIAPVLRGLLGLPNG